MSSRPLSKLLSVLGYADAPGFIRHEHLKLVARHRHALRGFARGLEGIDDSQPASVGLVLERALVDVRFEVGQPLRQVRPGALGRRGDGLLCPGVQVLERAHRQPGQRFAAVASPRATAATSMLNGSGWAR